VPDIEGGVTKLMPDGTVMRVFEAAEEYLNRAVPLVVVAGRNYGCGSSRDWAAKGVALLGVKAVIAESFERIHRTNLVGMGVLPLQLPAGTTAKTLRLDGTETFDVTGLAAQLGVRSELTCTIHRADGTGETIMLVARLDTQEDVEYWRHGGILPRVWRSYVTGTPMRQAEGTTPVSVEADAPARELPDALQASDMPSETQGASIG
jgi:aconitate hydratase